MPSTVARSLSRLSREKLTELCISWTKTSKSHPYLTSNRNLVESVEEDYLHEPAQSRKSLNDIYKTLQDGSQNVSTLTKKDIIDRIVDGDWRRGLTHNQLASIDFANLEENDTALRWTALKLVPLNIDNATHEDVRPKKRRKIQASNGLRVAHYPDITLPLFVEALKTYIAPLVKAHYHIHRIAPLNLTVVRLYVSPNAPFAPLSTNTPRQHQGSNDSARTMFIALPDSCPYVYVSMSGSTEPQRRQDTSAGKGLPKVDIAATKRIVLEAIPKALSRPQQRWSLETTKLVAKSLKAMSLLRGGGVVGVSGGSFSQLMCATQSNTIPASTVDSGNGNADDDVTRVEAVEKLFGPQQGSNHAKLDHLQVKVQNLRSNSKKSGLKRKFVHDEDDANDLAPVTITLTGNDVFAGLKQFALNYPEFIDLKKFPSQLTGAGNTSIVSL